MKRIFFALIAVIFVVSCANAGNKNNKTVTQSGQKSSKSLVTNISQAEYKDKIEDYTTSAWDYKGELPAVVDFYADWCGPCRKLAPVMEEVAKQFEGKVNFYKVNVDNASALARAYGVSSIPMVVFIPVDGEPVTSLGLISEEDFVKKVNENCLK